MHFWTTWCVVLAAVCYCPFPCSVAAPMLLSVQGEKFEKFMKVNILTRGLLENSVL